MSTTSQSPAEQRADACSTSAGGSAKRGRFITFEGIDGAGKSTQIKHVIACLRANGRTVVESREPGGTPLGEALRGLLLSQAMHPDTEAMLMFAARREHIAQVIAPALEAGKWVVCDRFTDASYAYQGAGRSMPATRLATLETWVQGDLQPDLTIVFDLPAAVAAQRISANRADKDRFELEQESFFERVRQGYLERVKQNPARYLVVDAQQAPESISKQLEEYVLSTGFISGT